MFATCRTIDVHFATISAPRLCFVDVAHQYKWFLMALLQSFRIFQPFSLLAFSMSFWILLHTCQMSNRCMVSLQLVRIHFAIPLWRSLINTEMRNPAWFMKLKHRCAPSFFITLLLPLWFDCRRQISKIFVIKTLTKIILPLLLIVNNGLPFLLSYLRIFK